MEGVEILDDKDSLVINIVPPTEFKEPEEEELEEEMEPEVIGKEAEGKEVPLPKPQPESSNRPEQE
jgi:hypothetical protein